MSVVAFSVLLFFLGSQDYENRSLDYVELHGETVACIKSYDLPTAA